MSTQASKAQLAFAPHGPAPKPYISTSKHSVCLPLYRDFRSYYIDHGYCVNAKLWSVQTYLETACLERFDLLCMYMGASGEECLLVLDGYVSLLSSMGFPIVHSTAGDLHLHGNYDLLDREQWQSAAEYA